MQATVFQKNGRPFAVSGGALRKFRPQVYVTLTSGDGEVTIFLDSPAAAAQLARDIEAFAKYLAEVVAEEQAPASVPPLAGATVVETEGAVHATVMTTCA
jgi:hypothetical protein